MPVLSLALAHALSLLDVAAAEAPPLSMTLRTPNDADPANKVLQALAVVLPPNTAQGAIPGDTAINAWSALYGATGQGATFPMLMLEEGRQYIERQGFGVWQGEVLALVHYIDRWDRKAKRIDQIWAEIDADLRLMKANLEDNPTLTCQLAGEATPTRHAVAVKRIDISGYSGSMNLGIYPFGLSARTLTVTVCLPAYGAAN